MENRKLQIKRLTYRSLHRGCKEMDSIIGSFAKDKLQSLDNSQLNELEELLATDDTIIYDQILSENYTINGKYNTVLKMIIEQYKL